MILRIVIALILLLGSGAGYVYFTGGSGLSESVQSKLSFIPQRSSESGAIAIPAALTGITIPQLPSNTSEQLEIVTERTGELTGTVGQVLGEAVKVASDSSEQTLQERAFDYGRYLYCQQVIKDYEARTTAEQK